VKPVRPVTTISCGGAWIMETKVGCAPIEGGLSACVKGLVARWVVMPVFTKGGA
jgi:hypothetical protein